ncbi:ESX secretion-associated protein EspG [Labedaea rhizosphaerae]|uniref:ESAT-6 protein secretion system EspG family protein n=1 Tax=Labedaea rhizosphaerae TaxID=598644 RepID=A0A4R6S9M5_LABRH|nr:ESX secretion-associated protein EspG [Labedaea rhizosphaerae]TDP96057.1 ESAT-6 protein secretion system EspG family protein [Labedaea rhizosphaerae]
MRDGVELTTDQLGHAIAHARLGDPHPCVAALPQERTGEQERAAKKAAWQEFVRLGLVSPSGALLPEFVDVLAMLVRPQTECSAWIAGAPGGDVAVLGAGTGDAAVLARRTGEQVSLRSADPATLIERVVRELPRFPDGEGPRIAVRQTEFSSGRGGPAELVALRSIVAQPRWGCAQLAVARRRRNGTRLRVQQPLTVLDTKGAGRWCTYLDEPWIVAAPGRQSWLVDKLSDWEKSLAG